MIEDAAAEPLDLAGLVGHLADPVLVLDATGSVTWGNTAAERLFGVSFEEGVGRDAFEFVHPDDAATAVHALSTVQSKMAGTLVEFRVRTPSGWRLAEVRGAPFGDHVSLVVRDLTDRRRWEVVRDEVARFRAVMQNGPTLTFLVDEDGRVVSSSGGLARLLGHDQEWLEGRVFSELVAPEDDKLFGEGWQRVQRTAARVVVDVRLVRANDSGVPYSLTLTNLRDDPTVEAVVVTGHDVSDRHAVEAQLRATNSLLSATLDSTADGILVVDSAGRVSMFNETFARMWGFPQHVLDARDDERALAYVLDQLSDPAAFLAKVHDLYAEPAARSHDVIAFKDGRLFERDSIPQRVGDTIVGRVWSFRDVTQQKRLQQQLEHQALHDALTGLANQVLLRDRIEHSTARLARTDERLAVLFIDVDDFKDINDTLGHWAGDEVLREVSRRLRSTVRPADTIARLGGDEFAVLIDDMSSAADHADIAQRIVDAVHVPICVGGRELVLGASVGIAFGDSTTNADELLRNADLAMYAAKRAGKNCYRIYTPEMHATAMERVDFEATLRTAIRHNEFILHYQPVYDLRTKHIVALEALARWNDPQHGLLGPDVFIPFAEQHGVIEELGAHLIAQACRDAAVWHERFGAAAAPNVTVNLSPRQLRDTRLPRFIEDVLRAERLPVGALTLELTESALAYEAETATDILRQLHQLGVRVAVDDFGTGYSSLAYLQRFPIDILKLDRAFVSTITPGEDQPLVRAIIQLAHTLGLTTIAEGVEHNYQADALIAYDCDLAQGFGLARPAALDATLIRLAQQLVDVSD